MVRWLIAKVRADEPTITEQARCIRKMEEDEASICPEDVGCVEYINLLAGKNAEQARQIEALEAWKTRTVGLVEILKGTLSRAATNDATMRQLGLAHDA